MCRDLLVTDTALLQQHDKAVEVLGGGFVFGLNEYK